MKRLLCLAMLITGILSAATITASVTTSSQLASTNFGFGFSIASDSVPILIKTAVNGTVTASYGVPYFECRSVFPPGTECQIFIDVRTGLVGPGIFPTDSALSGINGSERYTAAGGRFGDLRSSSYCAGGARGSNCDMLLHPGLYTLTAQASLSVRADVDLAGRPGGGGFATATLDLPEGSFVVLPEPRTTGLLLLCLVTGFVRRFGPGLWLPDRD